MVKRLHEYAVKKERNRIKRELQAAPSFKPVINAAKGKGKEEGKKESVKEGLTPKSDEKKKIVIKREIVIEETECSSESKEGVDSKEAMVAYVEDLKKLIHQGNKESQRKNLLQPSRSVLTQYII